MSTIDDLKAKLADLKSRKVDLSDEEKEEITIRDQIGSEENRLSAERERKRKLEVARRLEAAKRKAGIDRIVEVVDLETEATGAGTWFVSNPPTIDAEKFKSQIKTNGVASDNDVRDLVMASLVDPDPMATEDAGVEIRDQWDKFPFSVQSLSAVVMRLGGLKIEEKRRKSS